MGCRGSEVRILSHRPNSPVKALSNDKAFSFIPSIPTVTRPAIVSRIGLCCSGEVFRQTALMMQHPPPLSFCSRRHARRFANGASLPDLVLACLLSALLLGCATPYHSEKSFWNGQTGFSQTQLGPDKWQLEFVGNELIDRETARKYVLKRAGEMALSQGYEWVEVNELTLSRDAVRVSPSHPVFGFDTDEPDPFLAQMQVQHTTSALLIFTLSHRSLNEQGMQASYLANIKINSD